MTDTLPALTAALEDYLETIYEQTLGRPFTRVRDIAAARGVTAASVSPALKRLAALRLVRHEQREYVVLTDAGVAEARRVFARHNLLARFFIDVLAMDEDAAGREACSMEHHLSNQAMDRLTGFFEYLDTQNSADAGFLERFHAWSQEHRTVQGRARSRDEGLSILDLEPGQSGAVTQVNATGAIRQRLLDMGILPSVQLRVERTAPTGDPIWIRFHGTQLALRRDEARAVQVQRV